MDESKSRTGKTRHPVSLITWGPLTAIIVVAVVYLASQIAAAFIIGLYPVARHMTSSETTAWLNSFVSAQFWVTVLVEAFSILILGAFLKRRKSNFKSIGLRGKPTFKDLGYLLVGFGLYFSAYYIAITIAENIAPSLSSSSNKQDIGFSTNTRGLAVVLIFISLVVLPPIVEEILFRGFLYSGLRSKFRKLTAALITSVIFASLHLIEGTGGILWVAGIDTFILSMVLVYLREQTDKLWASMALHMVKNFIAFASLFIFHLS